MVMPEKERDEKKHYPEKVARRQKAEKNAPGKTGGNLSAFEVAVQRGNKLRNTLYHAVYYTRLLKVCQRAVPNRSLLIHSQARPSGTLATDRR
jgi:hypothetical protein